MIMEEILDEATREAIIKSQAEPEVIGKMIEQLYGENTLYAIETYEGLHVCSIFYNGQEITMLGIKVQMQYGYYLEKLDEIDQMTDEQIKEKLEIKKQESSILTADGLPMGTTKKIILPEEKIISRYYH